MQDLYLLVIILDLEIKEREMLIYLLIMKKIIIIKLLNQNLL